MHLHDSAVYTTIAPERLQHSKRGELTSDELFESKRWVAARKMFQDATKAGAALPVLFSDARNCVDLLYWARVTDIRVTEAGTCFRFSHLTKLRGHTTQELVLLRQERPIAPGFIRPYALVRTPSFLWVTEPIVSTDPSRLSPESNKPSLAPPLQQVAMEENACRDVDSNRMRSYDTSPGEGDRPVTLFSWGYSGWGNSVPQLLRITDEAERSRGYEPPVFVDVRFSRSVRANGFRDSAFEDALPPGRYHYIKGLGNEGISWGGIKIHKRGAAVELLDLALAESQRRRRVIFFCSCESPKICHRNQVRSLVLKAAKKRGLRLTIAEWPGGEPAARSVLSLRVAPQVFASTLRGAKRIPVDEPFAIGECSTLPWGSVIDLSDGTRQVAVAVGPAQYRADGWFLPVFIPPVEAGDAFEDLEAAIHKVRTSNNYKIFSQG